jgi:2-dehydropantoate 2-reductase
MMRIAIMAAGGVGGYFGARLAAAGNDVIFFARGGHLDAIRESGLKVDSVHGNLHVKDVVATDTAEGVAPVDIVLFAVKLWDSERAATVLKSLIGPATRVITVQNGIGSAERLASILGEDPLVKGVARISSVIAAPGVISHTGHFHSLRFGYSDGHHDQMLSHFVRVGKAAGLPMCVLYCWLSLAR